MKSFIPNLLTLANLASGLLAISVIFSGNYILAAWLVGASLVFDFLDGFVARLLKVHSELGKQLDSLADVVSFGVVPGFLMFHILKLSQLQSGTFADMLPYLAFLTPLLSALRLGKFNIDTRQADYFIGMPTPANTIFLFSIALTAIHTENEAWQNFLLHPAFLAVLIIVTSYLLVAELPLLALKIKNLKWEHNKGQYILVAGTIVLIALLGLKAIAFIIPLYLLLSLIFKPGR